MSNSTDFAWTVIGAGPAGIAAIGSLLDSGIKSEYIAWIDPEFKVGLDFTPLMTLYLTEQTTPTMIEQAKKTNYIFGCKLYPAGATTHSTQGVQQLEKIYPTLAAMEKLDLPLQVHAEVTDSDADIFAREAKFIDLHLAKIHQQFPNLQIVMEHVSSKIGVEWILSADAHVGATITAHHLLLNRNDLLVGGIKPHYYCLPILKSHADQQALIKAATSGNPKFFLGTDSAPHSRQQKETACGCAGIFTSHAALGLYAEVFEQVQALNKLEAFASFFGADFYHLPRNHRKITLRKQPWQVNATMSYGEEELVPFRAGQLVQWEVLAHA